MQKKHKLSNLVGKAAQKMWCRWEADKFHNLMDRFDRLCRQSTTSRSAKCGALKRLQRDQCPSSATSLIPSRSNSEISLGTYPVCDMDMEILEKDLWIGEEDMSRLVLSDGSLDLGEYPEELSDNHDGNDEAFEVMSISSAESPKHSVAAPPLHAPEPDFVEQTMAVLNLEPARPDSLEHKAKLALAATRRRRIQGKHRDMSSNSPGLGEAGAVCGDLTEAPAPASEEHKTELAEATTARRAGGKGRGGGRGAAGGRGAHVKLMQASCPVQPTFKLRNYKTTTWIMQGWRPDGTLVRLNTKHERQKDFFQVQHVSCKKIVSLVCCARDAFGSERIALKAAHCLYERALKGDSKETLNAMKQQYFRTVGR